jgi:hypothetical protein
VLRGEGEAQRHPLHCQREGQVLRHWLAARLHAERPALHARLPRDYNTGAPLTDFAPPPAESPRPPANAHGFAAGESSLALFW